MEETLLPEERAVLQRVAAEAKPVYARRAIALLLWGEGLAVARIAEQASLSPQRVRFWLREFRVRRLNIFPLRVRQAFLPSVAVSPSCAPEPMPAADAAAEGAPAVSLPPETMPEELASETPPIPVRPAKPGLLPEDAMSEAGRKVLYFHFLNMLDHEQGTRLGDDIEELHDMRVATRRMRAAFRVFAGYFRAKTIAPFVKELRKLGASLGAVRDLDVFMDKAERYLRDLPPAEQHALDPLLASWQAQRVSARSEMIAYLDSDQYRAFCASFASFLTTPGEGARSFRGDGPMPVLVREVAPTIIYQRLGDVRAFDGLVLAASVTQLHALRISCKHLRYTLEFFSEALGPEAKGVIKQIVAMQDHLGALQDAVVASDLLRGFLNEWAERQKTEPDAQRVAIYGVTSYLAAKQIEMFQLLEAFPAAWARLSDPSVRRDLAAAVGAL